MRRAFRFGALLMVLALLSSLVLTTSAQDEGDNVFTFGTFGDPVELDPAVVTDGVSFRVTTQGCEALLFYDGSTTNVIPGLASSWETSEDGLTWTLQLEEDVMFHDGTPFNAEAVVWNFEHWQFPAEAFADESFTYYNYMFGEGDDSFVESVEATGEYEVTFTLKEPNGGFLNTLAMPMFSIASPTFVQEAGADYGSPDVGYSCTGPYAFGSWTTGENIILERFDDYWDETPGNVDTIVFQQIPDNAARFAALQSGQIDAFEQPNVEDLPAIEDSEELYTQTRGPLNILYLAFNYRIQEFRDQRVREAMSLAFDRQAIAEAFYPPGAIPAATMLPPSLWGHNEDIAVDDYDPERARELLAEAGYPDGFSEVNVLGVDENGQITDEVVDTIPVQLFFQPVTRPYNPDGEGIGDAMVSYLADIGIDAELASAGDWSTFLDRHSDGDLIGLYQLGWTGDNGDPDNFIGYHFINVDDPDPTEGYYENEELASLLQEARRLVSQEERAPLYEEAEAVLDADTGRIFIAHTGVPLAFRSCIEGYVTNPVATEHYKFVTTTCE
jgi:peptide/nickel transport system substrate-binding protein